MKDEGGILVADLSLKIRPEQELMFMKGDLCSDR
jgi:hypothetical protein